MGFISTNCPSCGSPIELDDSREFSFCQFCGTKIVQDKIVVEHKGEEQKMSNGYANQGINLQETSIPDNATPEEKPGSTIQQTDLSSGKKGVKGFFAGYKDFKSLTIKQKLLHIAVPIILFIIIVSMLGGGSSGVGVAGSKITDEQVETVAKYEVSKHIMSKSSPVFSDLEIVDKDGHNRYIVTLSSDGKFFKDRWAVWIEFDETGEYYHTYADYHGSYSSKYGSLSQEELVNLFKTNPDFRWGNDTYISNNKEE